MPQEKGHGHDIGTCSKSTCFNMLSLHWYICAYVIRAKSQRKHLPPHCTLFALDWLESANRLCCPDQTVLMLNRGVQRRHNVCFCTRECSLGVSTHESLEWPQNNPSIVQFHDFSTMISVFREGTAHTGRQPYIGSRVQQKLKGVCHIMTPFLLALD